MILNISQTKTNFNMEWIVTQGECLFAEARAPFEKGRFTISVDYKEASCQRLYFNPTDTTWGSKMVERMSFKIFEDNNKVGHIVGKTQKTGFLKAYPYYEFEYNQKLYYGYEVGFGSKGLFLCIYDGEKLIAIVDKKLRVVNFRDSYTAYVEGEQYVPVVVPFTLYYDSATYGDVMDIAVVSIKEKRVNTVQKELIAKYDPTFIPKVKAMEGLAE